MSKLILLVVLQLVAWKAGMEGVWVQALRQAVPNVGNSDPAIFVPLLHWSSITVLTMLVFRASLTFKLLLA